MVDNIVVLQCIQCVKSNFSVNSSDCKITITSRASIIKLQLIYIVFQASRLNDCYEHGQAILSGEPVIVSINHILQVFILEYFSPKPLCMAGNTFVRAKTMYILFICCQKVYSKIALADMVQDSHTTVDPN